jgi:photosystem II stability/assembly factor-like uncharacterized protein
MNTGPYGTPMRRSIKNSIRCCVFAALTFCVFTQSAPALGGSGVRRVDNIFSVAEVFPGRWIAVGSKGLILRSADDGRTWERGILRVRTDQDSDVFQDFDLYSVRFTPDFKAGWIGGENGLIFYSSDGGSTWSRRTVPGFQKSVFRIAPIDTSRACAVGTDGTLLCTTDEGKHWVSRPVDQHIDLYDLTFVGGQGWAVGAFNTILHSSDGGADWQLQAGGYSKDRLLDEQAFFAVAFRDGNRGEVAGLAGKILLTDDGGRTWRNDGEDSKRPSLFAVSGVWPSIWAAGKHGAIIQHSDGSGWKTIELRGARQDITDLAVAHNTALAVGLQGTILRTGDGGKVWTSVAAQ